MTWQKQHLLGPTPRSGFSSNVGAGRRNRRGLRRRRMAHDALN